MTLEEESRLSYYKEISDIRGHRNVALVKHVENGRIYVKKRRTVYDRQVYEILMEKHHPFYPGIIECVTDGNDLIVIETYVPGETIQEMLEREKRFTLTETARIMCQICEGIHFLHTQNPPVIHRDIKPSNLILTDDGIVKMIDCNAARRYEDGKTKDTVLFGTRGFAAPEQYGFRQTDARTDIYSMGILANVLLTGHVPQDGMSVGKEQSIIEKCIELDPQNRYSDMMQLKQAWEQCFNDKTEKESNRDQSVMTDKTTADSLLPPGFRSKTLWKMLLAIPVYAFLIWLPVTTEFKSNDVPMTGYHLWLYRIAILLMEAGTVVLWGNYRRLQERIPLPKNSRLLRAAVIAGYTCIWFFLIIVMISILIRER